LHKDITTAHILLDLDENAKLGDVGMRFGKVGSPGYIDPEYVTTQTYNTSSDVFAFGVVIMQLLTGRLAFIDGT